MTTHRVCAIIIDKDWQGLGLPQGTSTKPIMVEFEIDEWAQTDVIGTLITEYSAQHRGGRRIEADDLELRCLTMMAVR